MKVLTVSNPDKIKQKSVTSLSDSTSSGSFEVVGPSALSPLNPIMTKAVVRTSSKGKSSVKSVRAT